MRARFQQHSWVIAVGVAIAVACWPTPARPACNVIPAASSALRSSTGGVSQPFARPGDWVEINLDPACDAVAPGFAGTDADFVATVIFTPPGGGPRNVVALAEDCGAVDTASCAADPAVADAFCIETNAVTIDFEVADPTHLRFRFPDTDAFLSGADDDLTFSGPATIAVTSTGAALPCGLAAAGATCAAQGGTIACVDRLFSGGERCSTTPDATFTGFTALPPPNDYQALCTSPVPPCSGSVDDIRFTVDADGNILLPMDWRGILIRRDAVPIARLLRGSTSVEAFEGRGAPIRIADLETLASYSPNGIILPPLFDPQNDPTQTSNATFFGSADAPETVLRIARNRRPSRQCLGGVNADLPCGGPLDCPGSSCSASFLCNGGARDGTTCTTRGDCPAGECGPGIFDFTTRLAASVGPVLLRLGACIGGASPQASCSNDLDCPGGQCGDFTVAALDPVPLEGFSQTQLLSTFVMEEAIPNPPIDMNHDGDTGDSVVKLFNRATGLQQPLVIGGAPEEENDGIAVVRVSQPPFSFPAFVADQNFLAFLQSESAEGEADSNSDGDQFDGILRVFTLGQPELTLGIAPKRAVDPAPRIDRRSFGLRGSKIYFRTSEIAMAEHAVVKASPGLAGAVGDALSRGGILTANGREILFVSDASNLVADDTNGVADVFVHDLVTGVTERVSLTDAEGEANAASGTGDTPINKKADADISADGRWVAFTSLADNLVPGDTNGFADLYVRDRTLGTTIRITRSHSGGEIDGDAVGVSLSHDGRFVSFTSDATNLGEFADMDLCLGAPASDGFVANRDIDADGTFDEIADIQIGLVTFFPPPPAGCVTALVAAQDGLAHFYQTDVDLAGADSNGGPDWYVGGNEVKLVPELLGTASTILAATAGGEEILVASADALTPGSESGRSALFVEKPDYDGPATTFDLVSRTNSGPLYGAHGTISADGRYVLFSAFPAAGAAAAGLYIRDRLTGTTQLIVPAYPGETIVARSLSADARVLGFDSSIPNLVAPADPDSEGDVFARLPDPADPLGVDAALFPDGDLDDTVLEVMDVSTGSVATLCPAGDVTVSAGGNGVAYLRPENAVGTASCPGGSLNGDADIDDQVVTCWDGGAQQSLGRAAIDLRANDTWLAARVSEAGDGVTYNAGAGDTDTLDHVLQVHPICGGGWVNTGLNAVAMEMDGSTVAFSVSESDQGPDPAPSLNDPATNTCPPGSIGGNATPKDDVLHVFDTDSLTLTNTCQAVSDFVAGGDDLVAYRALEANQLAILNDDGDTLDQVLQVYDGVSGRIVNSEQAATACTLEACDPRFPYRVLRDTVRFLTLEAEQGRDLNGDGDQNDLVVQMLNVRQACSSGSAAGACRTLAAVPAGICTDTAEACASDAACPAGKCFVPPGGCIRDLGTPCDPSVLPPDPPPCPGGEFCNPISGMPDQGTCQTVEGPCLAQADCVAGAVCSAGGADFNRLFPPLNAPAEGGGDFTITGQGTCVEDLGIACVADADCSVGQYCESGTCRRDHQTCAGNADCPTGSYCRLDVNRQTAVDTDGDEMPDVFDNCRQVANVTQEDGDGDGIGDACDSDDVVSGKRLLVRDKGGDASQRKVVFLSRDAAIRPPAAGGTSDPRIAGARFVLRNPVGGESASFDLPAANWKGLGRPAGSKGYRYGDPTQADGPCKLALIKDGVLRVVCAGAGVGFDLDETSQGELAARFVTGEDGYCAGFGGTVGRDTQAGMGVVGVFRAVSAPAPPSCEVP